MNLRDAIGKDIYTLDGKQYTDDDLQKMSIEDLETLKIRINKVIGNISLQIKEKKFDHSSGGKGATKDWYVRHRDALSINQQVLQYLHSLVKKRRHGRRTISDYFMDEANVALPPDVYARILKNAHREMEIMREGASYGS